MYITSSAVAVRGWCRFGDEAGFAGETRARATLTSVVQRRFRMHLVMKAAVAVLFVLSASAATAQSPATISGTVTTRADGLSVPGATVTLVGSSLTATTDSAGRYTIEVPPAFVRAGKVQLRIEALGLPPKIYDVELTPEAKTTLDVALSVGFEEQVTVGSRAAGAESQKAVPVDVITQEQIAASGYAETAQVIQALAPSFNFPRPTITDGTARSVRQRFAVSARTRCWCWSMANGGTRAPWCTSTAALAAGPPAST